MKELKDLIFEAIEASGRTQAEIAREMGISPQSVNGWVTTGRIGKRNLARFAGIVRLPLSHFMGGKENTDSAVEPARAKLPLISWVQAGQKNPVSDPFPPGAPEEWQEANVAVSDGAFALRVRGDSMVAPDGSGFPEGSIIIVDPTQEARNGDFVVVRFQDSDEATFKRLMVDGPIKFLKPLNPSYPNIPVTEDARLAGVVVEHILTRKFR